MEQKIIKICKEIEQEKKIKILFAVENGSRAWRMDSKDSDYDVRFVFFRPVEEYLKINKSSEVISRHYDKEGNPQEAMGCFIDVCGFDITKFTKMLSSSNPTVIEWLTTDIVYYGKQNKVFKDFALNNFSPISLCHHYKSMCKNNYLKYLKSGKSVTYKKYLYAYRGLINSMYVETFRAVPPIDLTKAIKRFGTDIPPEISKKILEIIKLKKLGKEKDIVQNIVRLDNYIEAFLISNIEITSTKRHELLRELNKELLKILGVEENKKEN